MMIEPFKITKLLLFYQIQLINIRSEYTIDQVLNATKIKSVKDREREKCLKNMLKNH